MDLGRPEDAEREGDGPARETRRMGRASLPRDLVYHTYQCGKV